MARILLVDDDTDVRLVFLQVLFDAGYQVDAVHSFDAGLAILDSGLSYDLLITDGSLPGGTGTRLADEANRRRIRSIIVTGLPPDRFDAGYMVVGKPLRPHELLEAVSQALGLPDP